MKNLEEENVNANIKLTPEQIISSVKELHELLRSCSDAFDRERIILYSNKIEELLKQLK